MIMDFVAIAFSTHFEKNTSLQQAYSFSKSQNPDLVFNLWGNDCRLTRCWKITRRETKITIRRIILIIKDK